MYKKSTNYYHRKAATINTLNSAARPGTAGGQPLCSTGYSVPGVAVQTLGFGSAPGRSEIGLVGLEAREALCGSLCNRKKDRRGQGMISEQRVLS